MIAPPLAVPATKAAGLVAGDSPVTVGWLGDFRDFVGTTAKDIAKEVVTIKKQDWINDLTGNDPQAEQYGEQRPVLDESTNTVARQQGLSNGEMIAVAGGGLAALIGLFLLVR